MVPVFFDDSFLECFWEVVWVMIHGADGAQQQVANLTEVAHWLFLVLPAKQRLHCAAVLHENPVVTGKQWVAIMLLCARLTEIHEALNTVTCSGCDLSVLRSAQVT